MRTRYSFRIKTAISNNQGSFTVEAALLFPILFAIVLLATWNAIYMFQGSNTYLTASLSADRTAHTWDNSYKHPATGMYTPLQRDPLYWRWLHDSSSAWFGMDSENESAAVVLPLKSPNGGSESLVVQKLSKAAEEWPQMLTGEGRFHSGLLHRTVSIRTAAPFHGMNMLGLAWSNQVMAASNETITEPTGYIRNIQLALTYLPQIKEILGVPDLQELLSPWLGTPGSILANDQKLMFRNHAEAVSYLRALVRGTERRISTEFTGKWRLIDAMDGQQIAHQAYIGAKSSVKDVTDQLLKDAELLNAGKLKGVVWHFFKREGDPAFGPSAALRQELQRAGIIVVIHQ